MKKISAKTRSLISKGITSLLSAMGFVTLHAEENKIDPVEPFDPDSISDYIHEEGPIALYGCPYADYKFTGHVIDKEGNPLSNVEILFEECDRDGVIASVKDTSDENGEFKVEYSYAPWCDIKISAKNDFSAAYDSISKEDIEKETMTTRQGWYYGVYSKDITIILKDKGELGKIIFNGTANIDDPNAEKVLLFSNPVENYLWFNIDGAEDANVAIYNFSGEKVTSASISNGSNLYVGDLKSGNYILTVISNDKKYVAKFIKK